MPRFLSVAQRDASTMRPIHAVLTGPAYKRLVVSGLAGVRPDGSLPEAFDAQAEQAVDNLVALIASSGLKREDVIAVCASVTLPAVQPVVSDLMGRKLAGFRVPAVVRQVAGLSQADSLIELDAEVIGES